MTDKVRTGLGGLAIAAAAVIVGAFFLIALGDLELPHLAGVLCLLFAGVYAVICLLRIGFDLMRPTSATVRGTSRRESGRTD